MSEHFAPGHYYSAPLNFADSVRDQLSLPKNVTFYDSTVRKVLMTPGIRLEVSDFVGIARMGRSTGMSECFLNVHWWGSLSSPEPHALKVAKAVMGETDYRVTLFTDVLGQENWREALDLLIELGPQAVQVCLPMPDASGQRPDVDRRLQIERLSEICAVLVDANVDPTVGALDCGRTDAGALREFIAAGLESGATRIDLSDSSSSLSPEAMKSLIRDTRGRVSGRPVTMHVHNDCGLANASCLAAVIAGGQPDVSACGISYRAGFAALEVVAAALESMYGVETGLDWENVQRLCSKIGSLLPGDALRGVSGSHAFLKESPGPVSAYLRATGVLPSAPDAVLVAEGFGAETRLVWGRQTIASLSAIKSKLERLGLESNLDATMSVQQILATALLTRTGYPVWLTDDEVSSLIFEREQSEVEQ